MPELLDLVEPADLTQYSRLLAAELDDDTRGPSLSRFLPNRTIEGVKTRRTRVSRTQTAAKFRAFDAPTPVGKRPVAVVRDELELAPLGQSLPIRERELIQLALAGGNDAAAVDLVGVIYDDVRNNVAAIRNRAEQLRGGLLFSGVITINENGFIQEADFGLAPSHNLSISDVGDAWDDPDTDSIDQELSWLQTVESDADASVVAMLTSRAVVNAMMKQKVYRFPLGESGGMVNRSLEAFNALRVATGLPPVYIYDKAIAGVRITPSDKIAYVTDTVGETQWGTTAEAVSLFGSNAVDEVTTDAPAITTAAWKEKNPVNHWTQSDATMLPVIGDINGLFNAQVLAGSSPSA